MKITATDNHGPNETILELWGVDEREGNRFDIYDSVTVDPIDLIESMIENRFDVNDPSGKLHYTVAMGLLNQIVNLVKGLQD